MIVFGYNLYDAIEGVCNCLGIIISCEMKKFREINKAVHYNNLTNISTLYKYSNLNKFIGKYISLWKMILLFADYQTVDIKREINGYNVFSLSSRYLLNNINSTFIESFSDIDMDGNIDIETLRNI